MHHNKIRISARGFFYALIVGTLCVAGCKEISPTAPAAVPLHITSIAPTCCEAGAQYIITGTGFKTRRDSNFVFFHFAYSPSGVLLDQLIVDSCTPTKLYVTAPSSIGKGIIYVHVGDYADSCKDSCVVLPQLSVTGFQPASGVAGTLVQISGTNFDTSAAPLHVLFGAIPAPILSLTSTQLTVRVPQNAQNGVLTLEYGCLSLSTSQVFLASPFSIVSFAPTQGTAGTPVNVVLNSRIDTNGLALRFNGPNAKLIKISGDTLAAVVPRGSTTGPINVMWGGASANSLQSFQVIPVMINSFAPQSGYPGDQVSLVLNLLPDTIGLTVRFNGLLANVVSVRGDTVVASVPIGAKTGAIEVSTNEFDVKSNNNFVVIPRSISLISMQPTWGYAGTVVTIKGSGFWSDTNGFVVTFGGVAATHISTLTDSTVTVSVPQGAVTGNVAVDGHTASSLYFTLFTKPRFSSCAFELDNILARNDEGSFEAGINSKTLDTIRTSYWSQNCMDSGGQASRPDRLDTIVFSFAYSLPVPNDYYDKSTCGSSMTIVLDTIQHVIKYATNSTGTIGYDNAVDYSRYSISFTFVGAIPYSIQSGGTLVGELHGALLNGMNMTSTDNNVWQGGSGGQYNGHQNLTYISSTDSSVFRITLTPHN